MAHFFVITRGSKIHAHVAHFFVDIYTTRIFRFRYYACAYVKYAKYAYF